MENMRLPAALEPASFELAFRPDHAAWRAAVLEVCRADGIACDAVAAFADGANLVAAVDDRWVVKIFPPFHRHQWESERRALTHLQGKQLPLKVPALIAEGTRDDRWPYLIMEKLPGQTLETSWDSFDAQDRARVVEQIGRAMAAVHRLPLGELATLDPEWRSFLRQQKGGCRARHLAQGAPPWFEQGVQALVSAHALDRDLEQRVLLTGEYTPFNLLAQRDEVGWQLTGMIDFGDAMVGPPDYDLLGPSMFTCEGDPRLVSALFRGYFGKDHPLEGSTRMRLMALAALHRYANFDFQLRIPRWRDRTASFEELAELIWPDSTSGIGEWAGKRQ